MRPRPISYGARRPTASQIAVSDAMHRGVVTCSQDTSLLNVAELMARERLHCIVVTDEAEVASALWGVVSDLDLVAAASVRDLDDQTAGAAAGTEALTIGANERLQRAAQLMTEHATSHLVVVDDARSPVGVLSTLDVAAALTHERR